MGHMTHMTKWNSIHFNSITQTNTGLFNYYEQVVANNTISSILLKTEHKYEFFKFGTKGFCRGQSKKRC